MTTTKTCTECLIEKPVTEFHRHSGYRDGRRPMCNACGLGEPRVIELDLPAAWPRRIRDMVNDVRHEIRSSLESLGYFDEIFTEREDEFRALFRTTPIRAFHCTRLLEHEVEWIRRHGLRPLTEQLVLERIRGPPMKGTSTGEWPTRLRRSHVFATEESDNRKNQICLFLSAESLSDARGRAMGEFMRYWGGEALSMSNKALELRPLLETLGRPAVVVVDLEVSAASGATRIYPGLLRAFVNRLVGEKEADAHIYYRREITPDRIIDIWTPGHPAYDRFPELPRT
jgi:hypothetical protein